MSDIDLVLALLTRIASGDYAARGAVNSGDEKTDALLTGLNMLAEELESQRDLVDEKERQLRSELEAYDHAPGLFCTLDHKGNILKCNSSFAAALGSTVQDLIGTSVYTRCPNGGSRMRERLEGGDETFEFDATLRRDDDALVTIAIQATTGSDPRNRRLVARDVTKERNLEEQLRQSQKMESVGRLSGGIAHDFNNLLTVVQTAAYLLRAADPGRPSEEIEMIEDAAKRGAGLTNQLLAFSRRQRIAPRPADLSLLVTDIERMVRRALGERIELRLDLQASIALVDPSQVSQVVMNLVINARDALSRGGWVRVRTHDLDDKDGAWSRLTVSDNGDGIPAEVLPKIFDPFFTTKPVGVGTGLGLSVCHGIVMQSGGRIDVRSLTGEGTSIILDFPRAPVDTRGVEEESHGAPPGGNEVILVVEDNERLRRLTARVLERAGYRVEVAADGAAALELAPTIKDLALILTDVVMPQLNGPDLMDRLREQGVNVRTIFMTGYAPHEVSERLFDDGVTLLNKPFASADLLHTLRQTLDREI